MNTQTLAQLLDGRVIGSEIYGNEEAEAKAHGLVVVFGASDDLVELRGAINDEVGAYDGGTFLVNEAGIAEFDEDDDEGEKPEGVEIRAIWDRDGVSWQYATKIPHYQFAIHEDDEIYCRGIVFDLDDVRKMLEGGEVADGSGI